MHDCHTKMCEFTHTHTNTLTRCIPYRVPLILSHTSNITALAARSYLSMIHRDIVLLPVCFPGLFLACKPHPNHFSFSAFPLHFCFSLQNPDNQTAPANRVTRTSNRHPMVGTRPCERFQTSRLELILSASTSSNNGSN